MLHRLYAAVMSMNLNINVSKTNEVISDRKNNKQLQVMAKAKEVDKLLTLVEDTGISMMEKLRNVKYADVRRKIIDSMQPVAKNERSGNICV